MQREIKFRAWDKKQSYMVYFGLFDHDHGYLPVFGVPEAIYAQEHDVMQYTGLKDKNGKEIYEFDIVKREEREGWFSENIAVVEWDNFYAGFQPFNETEVGYHIFDNNGNVENVEIIGNKFENPELVTKYNL